MTNADVLHEGVGGESPGVTSPPVSFAPSSAGRSTSSPPNVASTKPPSSASEARSTHSHVVSGDRRGIALGRVEQHRSFGGRLGAAGRDALQAHATQCQVENSRGEERHQHADATISRPLSTRVGASHHPSQMNSGKSTTQEAGQRHQRLRAHRVGERQRERRDARRRRRRAGSISSTPTARDRGDAGTRGASGCAPRRPSGCPVPAAK